VQPCNRTHNRQVFEIVSGCTTGCTVAPVSEEEERAAFEERAAILEYDGGFTRAEAEAQAAAEGAKKDAELIGEIPPGLDRRSGAR
jgi:hypothetical protein